MPRSDWLLARLDSAVKRRKVSHTPACMLLRMVPVPVPVPVPGHASRLWHDGCVMQIREMICSTARGIGCGLLAIQTESMLMRTCCNFGNGRPQNRGTILSMLWLPSLCESIAFNDTSHAAPWSKRRGESRATPHAGLFDERPDRGAVDRGRDETDSICCLHGAIAKRPAQAEDSTDVAIYST